MESLVPRIVTLGQAVNVTATDLERVISALPERQRSHSRVIDVQRALSALKASVPRLPQ